MRINIIKLRTFINQNFIQNDPAILEEIHRQYRIKGRPESVLGRGKLVFGIYLNNKLFNGNRKNRPEKLRENLVFPESQCNQKISEAEWMSKISKADVIVFDAWNVLIQPLVTDSELYAYSEVVTACTGLQVCMLNKQQISDEAFEMIQRLRSELVIDNEFMHAIYNEAISQKKTVLIVDNIENISKIVTREALKRFNYSAKLIGMGSIPKENSLYITTYADDSYKSVYELGGPYRPWIKNNIVTDIYDNIVNLHLHGSSKEYAMFYEYGYLCGGILTAGYCQYLNRLAKEDDIDKILFVARDCCIIQKVYNKFFGEIDNSYLVTSRFSAVEMLFYTNPMEYINENIRTRIWRKKSDNTIGKILKECGIECVEKYLNQNGISANEDLDDSNIKDLTDIILEHKEEIAGTFANSTKAGCKYIRELIGTAKKIAIVDIGWRGKSFLYIKKLLEEQLKWDGKAIGVLIGANDNPATQDHIRQRNIKAFAFDDTNSRNCSQYSNIPWDEDEVLCIEALFSSEADTLLRYSEKEDGTIGFIYGRKNENIQIIRQVHQGIIDFCDEFVPMIQKYGLTVTAKDAYTPLDSAMRNKKLKKLLRDMYKELPGAMNGF
jgi:hypothetical protein